MQRTSLRSPLIPRLGAPARRYTSVRAVPSRPRTTARTERPMSRISASRLPAKHDRRFSTARILSSCPAVFFAVPGHRPAQLPVPRPACSSPRTRRFAARAPWRVVLGASSAPGVPAQHPRSTQHQDGTRTRCNALPHGVGGLLVHLAGRKLCGGASHSAVRRPGHRVRSTHLRSRPRAVHRSAVSRVVLNPPRFHPVAPNPACSGLRFARR